MSDVERDQLQPRLCPIRQVSMYGLDRSARHGARAIHTSSVGRGTRASGEAEVAGRARPTSHMPLKSVICSSHSSPVKRHVMCMPWVVSSFL